MLCNNSGITSYSVHVIQMSIVQSDTHLYFEMFSYFLYKSLCFYWWTSLVSEQFNHADKLLSYEQLLQPLSFLAILPALPNMWLPLACKVFCLYISVLQL